MLGQVTLISCSPLTSIGQTKSQGQAPLQWSGEVHFSDGHGRGRRKRLLNNNHSQLMILFYFSEQSKENYFIFSPPNCQLSYSLCPIQAICLLLWEGACCVNAPDPASRWLPSLVSVSFSPGSFPSANMLPYQTLSWFDFSSSSRHQPNLLFFIAKLLTKVAPKHSSNYLTFQFQSSFYPPH